MVTRVFSHQRARHAPEGGGDVLEQVLPVRRGGQIPGRVVRLQAFIAKADAIFPGCCQDAAAHQAVLQVPEPELSIVPDGGQDLVHRPAAQDRSPAPLHPPGDLLERWLNARAGHSAHRDRVQAFTRDLAQEHRARIEGGLALA